MTQQTQTNSFQLAGKVLEIHMPERISEKLTKQCVVIETWTGQYSNPVIFEAKNQRATQINDLKVGEWAIVTFELSGRKYQKDGQAPRFFNTLNLLTIIKG